MVRMKKSRILQMGLLAHWNATCSIIPNKSMAATEIRKFLLLGES